MNEQAFIDGFIKQAYVRQEGGKYFVHSEKGKKLSRGYATEAEANKRLQQIEYFKHKNAECNEAFVNGFLKQAAKQKMTLAEALSHLKDTGVTDAHGMTEELHSKYVKHLMRHGDDWDSTTDESKKEMKAREKKLATYKPLSREESIRRIQSHKI